ncbi:hypothetical protein ONZ51_g13584 [Trametes cubensis]|uniref:Protein kinase domain-containing protein n=1 Tax=Trametes cubensis TaxID=1111947 RepID=A0AAD7TGA4_9APHY|nr:hypothetical protein ONZ51_g13584 [Trametes cubensis]
MFVAHKQAAKAGILHRDISGGNILIYPKIVKDPDNPGCNIVMMNGLLTDWELSKDIKVKGRARRARQPERTGTWQYMSIALINEPTKAVEISDELEAFFHVLLYYAVRYIKSNCKDVPAYMELYFEAYRIYGGRYRCGSLKTFTITTGELHTSESTRSVIRFGSALDHIFRTILRWLKAHYDVHEDKYIWKGDEGSASKNTEFDRSGRGKGLVAYFDASVDVDDMDDAPSPETQKLHSEQTLKDAQKLCRHDNMLVLLYTRLTADSSSKSDWPTTDKVPDQCPDDNEKNLEIVPSDALGTLNDNDNDSNKRLKSNSGAAVPVQHPPQTPPRKSHHSSIGIVDSGFASGSRPAAGSCPP